MKISTPHLFLLSLLLLSLLFVSHFHTVQAEEDLDSGEAEKLEDEDKDKKPAAKELDPELQDPTLLITLNNKNFQSALKQHNYIYVKFEDPSCHIC